MFKTVLPVLGGGFVFGVVGLTGEYFYTHYLWLSNHPLIQESLDLILKDPSVLKALGPDVQRRGLITGVLEPHKKWASVSFNIQGKNKANVNLIADAMEQQNITDQYFPVPFCPPPSSYLDKILEYLEPKKPPVPEYRWRIASLSVTFDEMYVYNLIGDGVRTHRELKETERLDLNQNTQITNIGDQRKKEVLNQISRTYWKMIGFGLFSFATVIFCSRFFNQNTVKNSLFLNKAIEILKTQEFTRNNLGFPLYFMDNIKGYLNYNQTKGNAKCYIHGPSGWGFLHIVGTYSKEEKTWKYSKIALKKDGFFYEIKL